MRTNGWYNLDEPEKMPNRKSGLKVYCRSCCKVYARDYFAQNPPKEKVPSWQEKLCTGPELEDKSITCRNPEGDGFSYRRWRFKPTVRPSVVEYIVKCPNCLRKKGKELFAIRDRERAEELEPEKREAERQEARMQRRREKEQRNTAPVFRGQPPDSIEEPPSKTSSSARRSSRRSSQRGSQAGSLQDRIFELDENNRSIH